MKYLCFVFCLLTILNGVHLEFVFPDDNPVTQKTNTNVRVPVSGHTNCPNSKYLYYPVKDNDWFCDCKPAFIYYKNDCFQAYRQGPCNPGQYLILPQNKNTAECVTNPCKRDGEVKFNNKCERLYTTSPCPNNKEGKYILDINIDTLELQCVQSNSIELSIIVVPNISCPRGGRRNVNGTCREVINT